ncbi:DUF411 domain-containing protein [Roseovarius aestuariivivens]|uniref:DUF411 domain-containing protein n=1 Tax=Roseovarius aestuariivivens TaxID=1888910 RepID=UPI001080255A|nr:DUF411 domain-containing protein [Roseovarius aestuariivivens]
MSQQRSVSRRNALLAGGSFFFTAGVSAVAHADELAPSDNALHVVKTPTCGCCKAWADLARDAGFSVTTEDTRDYVGMKRAGGVPQPLWSCHTARIAGYTVEGHVPFDAIRKLLSERPDISGLSVPGMPAGSPGMGNDPTAVFDVIAFGGTAGDGQVYFTAGQ